MEDQMPKIKYPENLSIAELARSNRRLRTYLSNSVEASRDLKTQLRAYEAEIFQLRKKLSQLDYWQHEVERLKSKVEALEADKRKLWTELMGFYKTSGETDLDRGVDE